MLVCTGAFGSTHCRRGASLAGYQPGIGILLPCGFALGGRTARYHASGGRAPCYSGAAGLLNSLIRAVLAEMKVCPSKKDIMFIFASGAIFGRRARLRC